MENKLIGRDEESKILQQLFTSQQSEFLALYGRRRVGKTFLIKQFFDNKQCLFFKITGTKNAPLNEQIRNFTKEISRVFYNNAPITAGKNWDETFEVLTAAINNQDKKIKVIFINPRDFPVLKKWVIVPATETLAPTSPWYFFCMLK